MKRIFSTIAYLAITLICLAAKGPTDEQLKTFCRNANVAIQQCESDAAKQEAFNLQVQEFTKQVDINKINAQQVAMLFEYGGTTLDLLLRKWLEPTLQAKAKNETLFGFYVWKYMPENDAFMHGAKETAAFIAFLSSKDLKKTVAENADIPVDIFNAMVTMKDANWHTEGFIDATKQLMECQLSDQAVMECVKMFNSAARVDTLEADVREHFRKACLKQYETLEASLDNARKKKACQEQIKYLQGPFACGTLVGNKAPQLHFLRVMKQEGDGVKELPVKSLDDLKGKVIMLDFWGTKCVPCLQSFPEVAEMQKHFEGKDVVILGVTSIQGYFIDTPNKRTIQCRNNPEKEMSLFPDYMKAMGMTWTVGISEEDVMNTDYGALAIPHIVIIDKNGNVRHNAVNADKETKIRLIEELL